MIYCNYYEADHHRQLSPDYVIIYNLQRASTSVSVTLNPLLSSPNIFWIYSLACNLFLSFVTPDLITDQ